MQKIHHQTKQAYLFSLVFYSLSFVLILLQSPIAPVLFSVSLLLSMIWVILAIREILRSPYISHTEQLGLTLMLIVLNIIGGLIYFTLIRPKVLGGS